MENDNPEGGAGEETPKESYQDWVKEVDLAEKWFKDKFYPLAECAIKRYLDKREGIDEEDRKFNLFAANVNILKSTLYSKPPRPDVRRKFFDHDDDVSRVASQIMERTLEQGLQEENNDFDYALQHSILDRLITGLGAVWLVV